MASFFTTLFKTFNGNLVLFLPSLSTHCSEQKAATSSRGDGMGEEGETFTVKQKETLENSFEVERGVGPDPPAGSAAALRPFLGV